MILSDKFVEELSILDKIDQTVFEKTINFAISYIVKHDTQTTLGEALEMDENDADKLFRLALKLISYYGKFKFGDTQFRQNIEFLSLKQDRKAFLLQKLEQFSDPLHKRLSYVESDGMPYFKFLDWRYDIQIASRTFNEEVKPRIFLNFHLENDKSEIDKILLECDYSNLKNLHQEIQYLVDQLESAKQQKIKKLGQML